MGELVDVGDTRLFVERRGSGMPVIILHGGPGADHTQLFDALAPLAEGFALYFVDQRSQGRSEKAPKETWTILNGAQDVEGLASALSLERYTTLGHSFGALVVLQHAVSFPEGAAALVVSHGVPSLRWYRLEEELEGFKPAQLREQVRDAWTELETVSEQARAAELIALQTPFHFKNPFDPNIAEMNRVTLEQMVHAPEVNQYMSATSFGGFNVEGSLPSIERPTLILTGRGERICPLDAAEFMAERIPHAELVIFEDSGHVSYLEERDRYLDVVRGFLQRNAAIAE